MKGIVIGKTKIAKGTDNIPGQQLYPFLHNRRQLRRQLGLELDFIRANTIAEIAAAHHKVQADVFFIRPFWENSAEEVDHLMQEVRAAHPKARIIFIDPWDQASSRFFGVLPYVDVFVKYQVLKNKSLYNLPLVGGTVLTDTLVREQGFDLEGWHVGSSVPEGYENRIQTGWFVTLMKRFQHELLKPLMPWDRFEKREIDLFCHVSYGPRDSRTWYGEHRKLVIDKLNQLAPECRLSVSVDYYGEPRKISSRQYFRDIRRSRIAVGPFGWGEITSRDYEAVCHGCLLFKPLVDHIDVEPNIFIPGKTYVPLRWDYSDLEEKTHYYLSHPDEANEIIHNARQAYRNYFKQELFVRKVGSLILKPDYVGDLEGSAEFSGDKYYNKTLVGKLGSI